MDKHFRGSRDNTHSHGSYKMTNQIVFDRISFAYSDGTLALSNTDISIAEGEKVALIGPNGAGKSTLLLHLNGILRGSGRIIIDGETIEENTLQSIRRKVGMIFQDPNDQLFCPTVEDDVAFGPLHFGLKREELDNVIHDALAKVEMEDAIKRPAHHLSLGERRRVTLAAVLACKPKILALDEPAAMLDPKRRRWLVDFLNTSTQTVILATHDLDFASRTCRRAVLMNEGKIVADGDIGEIMSNSKLLADNDLEPLRTVTSDQ